MAKPKVCVILTSAEFLLQMWSNDYAKVHILFLHWPKVKN